MFQIHQNELQFAVSLLKKMRIESCILHPKDVPEYVEKSMHAVLGIEGEYLRSYPFISRWSEHRTIYKIMDPFLCHYIYFRLPGEDTMESFVIGPYITEKPSEGMMLELISALNLPVPVLPQMRSYYAGLPVCQDTSTLIAIVSTLGDTIWGKDNFSILDVNYEQQLCLPWSVDSEKQIEQASILQQMKQQEEHYAYEGQIMEIISKGQTSRAEMVMSHISQRSYAPRSADPLRSMKNYCIICNTLSRKAAQQGGVHPFYLDKMSGEFASLIENTSTLNQCRRLIGEMVQAYCRLVKNNASNAYSGIVEKVLIYINENLSGDLSLSTLSQVTGVSPGYLSTVFHRETGHTLADHILESRMKAALHLLKTSRLQVQTVAQMCGFSDPNYFSKQFKRFYSIAPLMYRKAMSGTLQTERVAEP